MKLQLTHPSIGTFAFELQPGHPLVLGRDTSEADLELPWDPHVSRRHARIHLERGSGTLWFEDLGSTNGSRYEGALVSDRLTLRSGDRVILGDTTLVVMPPDDDPWADETEPVGSDHLGPTTEPAPPVPRVGATADPDELRIRFVGPSRVRIEGRGLQALWEQSLTSGWLFVPGSSPTRLDAQVWVDLSVDDTLYEMPAKVVNVGTGPDGIHGTKLELGRLPDALSLSLERGADETTVATMEIEAPPELIEAASRPHPEDELGEDAQRFVGLVASNRPYEALDLSPKATDAEVTAALAHWAAQAAPAGPLARAVAIVRSILGDPRARLRFDFAHGNTQAERRLELARRGEGPSTTELAAAWRRTFPARCERARRLGQAARDAERLGNWEEAGRLREQARQLAPFQTFD